MAKGCSRQLCNDREITKVPFVEVVQFLRSIFSARHRGFSQAMLAARLADTQSRDVFPSESDQPYLVTSLDHLHSEVRPLLQLPKDGVIHSLRHTYGTRLGEGRADAFNYHEANGAFEPDGIPALCSPETLEGAAERLQALNLKKDREALPKGRKLQLPATIPATSTAAASVSPVGPVAQLVRAADS